MANISQEQVDAFVHRVVGWSQTLQLCADAGVLAAQRLLAAGEITFVEFNQVLQHKVTVTQRCIAAIEAASQVLAKVTEAQISPIEAAADRLQAATDKLKNVTDGVTLLAELTVAAGALVAALGAPGLASIAAAAAAVTAVAEDLSDNGD